MSNINPNNLKVGDTIMVEEAWEDETGAYHDEAARILAIDEKGELTLDFYEANDEVREFLKATDGYMAEGFVREDEANHG